MTIDLDVISWAVNEGLWDGNEQDSPLDHYQKLKLRIIELALRDVYFGAHLAMLGASDDPETQRLIAEEFSKGEVLQCGFGKSLSKFWKKHKVAIIVGICVVAAATAIGIAIACSGGIAAAASGTVAAVGVTAAGRREEESEYHPSPLLRELSLTEEEIAQVQQIDETLKETLSEPNILDSFNPNFDPYHQFPKFAPKSIFSDSEAQSRLDSWYRDFSPRQEDQFFRSLLPEFTIRPKTERLCIETTTSYPSLVFHTEGKILPQHQAILCCNGINTRFHEAISHANHLKKFTPNLSVTGIYNKTHGSVVDGAEVLALNWRGISPNTADTWKQALTEFHYTNWDKPNAKAFCNPHSQGAIHLKNALVDLPKEIQQRAWILAIAPGEIIPKRLCYDSFNYACEGDPVPHLKDELVTLFGSCQYEEDMKELIIIPRPPNASRLEVHGMEHYVYDEIYKQRIEDYLEHKGIYP